MKVTSLRVEQNIVEEFAESLDYKISKKGKFYQTINRKEEVVKQATNLYTLLFEMNWLQYFVKLEFDEKESEVIKSINHPLGYLTFSLNSLKWKANQRNNSVIKTFNHATIEKLKESNMIIHAPVTTNKTRHVLNPNYRYNFDFVSKQID